MLSTGISDSLFTDYAFYASLLLLEFAYISFRTGQARLKNKAFANPEDAARHGGLVYCRDDPEVDRFRRIHRNDLENIPAFLIVSALYAFARPSQYWFRWLMRCYVISRMLYTCAYQQSWRAPFRSIIYSIGLYLIMIPMLICVLYSALW